LTYTLAENPEPPDGRVPSRVGATDHVPVPDTDTLTTPLVRVYVQVSLVPLNRVPALKEQLPAFVYPEPPDTRLTTNGPPAVVSKKFNP
jgi:hypothetical protein